MEIVVTGRNVEVPEHFRVHVAEKVERLERYDHKIVGMEVELFHERNRRQMKNCQRVEITGRGCGPVARAEACAQDFYSALDAAIAKLEARLRRSHDRRRITARRTTVLVGRGGGQTMLLDAPPDVDLPGPRASVDSALDLDLDPTLEVVDDPAADLDALDVPDADDSAAHVPGQIVRRKVHTAHPMSVDDALSRMELVGHDFYLFADSETGAPSVVYRRRKGYDYGVIRLAH